MRDAAWSVRPGEHWVILGANGCGQTSHLRALGVYRIEPRAPQIASRG